MPRDGETPLARFAQALARDDGLTIGNPWLSDEEPIAVLPLVRTGPHPRRCVLAAEAAESITATDPGRLDRLTVCNDGPVPVLLPPGTLFRGLETPSRGTTRGVVLAPRSRASVEVRCVHASRPITPGATLEFAPSLAPEPIARSLLTRDQGRVWAAVAQYVHGADGPSGDLLAEIPETIPAATPLAVPSGIPILPGQCGIAIVDALGVVAVEWYDASEGWKVAAAAVLQRYAGRLRPSRNGSRTASLDPSGAVRAVKEFVSTVAEDAASPEGRPRPHADQAYAACTVHEGRLVHLLAFARRDREDHVDGVRGAAIAEVATSYASDPVGPPTAFPAAGDADVAAAEMASADLTEDSAAPPPAPRPRRRKVLTSGWDDATFGAVDRYARKEFRGDRSAAMRFLIRQGLGSRGYFGPIESRSSGEPTFQLPPASAEPARRAVETRLEDLERIAETPDYAVWLRKRARLELERLATTLEDELLRTAAQAARDRLAPVEPEPAPVELPDSELEPTPAPAVPIDVRPLLRQAFAASAGGDYRQALALFDRVLDAEPGHRTARLGRAVAFRRAGKSQEALDDLEAVLRIEPRNAAALLARGQILQARGDLDGALASFDLLVDVAASDWDIWMGRGDVLAKMGRNEDALRSYGEALRRNPEDQGLRGRIRTVEMARVSLPPTTLPRAPVPPGIEVGQSYLVKEVRRDRSQSVFRALAGQRMPALVLTGRSRDVVRREVGVAGARIIGLSFTAGEDLHNPTALPSLIRTIERFVYDNQGRGVILLEGLHDLVVNNGFREAALCLERIHEAILQSQAILLVSVAPGDLEEREAALLERSLRLLP